MTDSRRPKRVAEEIREYLGASIVTELSDPRLSSLVFTRVEVTGDLSIADAYFRLLTPQVTPKLQQQAERTLVRAGGRLRRGLASLLKSKRVPEFRFFYDSAPDARARVDELLHEISLDEQHREPEPAAEPSLEATHKSGDGEA